MRGCKQHHYVWRYEHGMTVIGCAHCPAKADEFPSSAGDDDRARVSQANHKQLCSYRRRSVA